MTRLANVLWSYWRAKRLRFESRDALESHQRRKLHEFVHTQLVRSQYFLPFVGKPFHTWPLMTKSVMMNNFDEINTEKLSLSDVLKCAMEAEDSRDFSRTVRGFSVGLSSGTSGSRGVFVVSPQEQVRWAGAMLAKLLPGRLFSGERVALFLRANNNLYGAVRSPWLSFEFFDLMEPFEAHFERLARYSPTIIVAPAQVLRALAEAKLNRTLQIQTRQVVSGAEVLEPFDRDFLTRSLGRVGEIYQATEGFLGATCAHGTLHLNEAHVHFEPQWLDDRRFVPLITDFTRTTQPIVRYRLDDILVRCSSACRCGSREMAIERIEGRCDDFLRLPARDRSTVDIFADGLSRAIAQVLPVWADYRMIQSGSRHLSLHVAGEMQSLEACRQRLIGFLEKHGVETSALIWKLSSQLPVTGFSTKRRRIVRLENP